MGKRYYIVGYYGYMNAGDDAILEGITTELTQRGVNYRYYYKGMKAFKVIKDILWANVVVLGGGTHFRNWGRKWIFQGLRIVLLMTLIRILNKQFHMWNVGIEGKGWEALSKLANYVSLRDHVTMDSALLIDYKPLTEKPQEFVIGVNLTPHNYIYYGRHSRDYAIWKAVFESIINSFKGLKCTIRFFSLNGDNHYSDECIFHSNTFKYLLASLGSNFKIEYSCYNGDLKQLIAKISECKVMIGMRYHSLVLAYLANIPIAKVEGSYKSTLEFNGDRMLLDKAKELARSGIKA